MQNRMALPTCAGTPTDGYSGANFQRPGFQAMLADIEAGKVGTVIVKDMSRLGAKLLAGRVLHGNTMDKGTKGRP